jgi:DNA-3-methyladenine glycosylase II
MVRTKDSIRRHVEALAGREPAFAKVIEQHGLPEPRRSEPGAHSLLRTIVGQQVSVAGISRQKAGYARSLAELVLSGELNLAALPEEDDEAVALLTRIKGIGRWSAEIYLLFAEGRGDVWPAGDLAVQIEIGRLLGLPDRPSETYLREVAEAWRPYRGAAAILAWHSYNSSVL